MDDRKWILAGSGRSLSRDGEEVKFGDIDTGLYRFNIDPATVISLDMYEGGLTLRAEMDPVVRARAGVIVN